jgi:hypothetical protein
MTEQELRNAIEARLRRNFYDELEVQIDHRLDNEREEAVERFLEGWEEQRSEEIRENLTDEFENGLDEAVDDHLAELAERA